MAQCPPPLTVSIEEHGAEALERFALIQPFRGRGSLGQTCASTASFHADSASVGVSVPHVRARWAHPTTSDGSEKAMRITDGLIIKQLPTHGRSKGNITILVSLG